MLTFTVNARSKGSRARAGTIKTSHGIIETPAFIPVGTKATVKSLTPEQIRDAVGAQAVLANTYHLYLQPGTDILEKAGGLGKFMNWPGPTFTDSGGFQAFSLGGNGLNRKSKIQKAGPAADRSSDEPAAMDMAKVTDEGVAFKSIIDGSSHMFTPERSIQIQHSIGADIIFAFDECLLPGETYERQKQAVERTSVWARRCLDEHARLLPLTSKLLPLTSKLPAPALFGIVQGGRHEDLRKLSTKQIGSMGFDGFGIGGSFDKNDIGTAVGWVADGLPEDRPRHLLGIGEPEDIILGIRNGMDTFDCVAPTRIARTGTAYSSEGRLNITNARFTDDFGPLDPACACGTCRNYSRAYLAHLFRAKEMLAATLVSIHNLYFVVNIAKKAREDILEGRI